jgi:hypothetical protein
MPEKAAFFHFYSAFCFIPREISGLVAAYRKLLAIHFALSITTRVRRCDLFSTATQMM